ncbi:hypothetical protein PVAND_003735 [Polypedilum vanderplanki]|uniref:URB1 C-terminal domain-containing protein n=1 Tax=Polypedilum vanderplanki TaxID=319348 RepID=A0A9J6BVG9_POLVA|nr:hypothetical protein PVAND_003735 [Polypedilum vanderplanki]
MIQVYSCSKNENYRKEAKLLTSKMLHSTQIFSSNNPIEISIWIEALRFIKPNLLKETANKFIELIKSIKKSDDMHEKLEIKRLNQNLLKMIDNFEESEEVVNSQLSSVLTTLLRMESGKLNKIIDFVEISFILFYHTYPDLKKSFKSLLATKSSEHSERFLAYINADELSNFQDILPTTPEFIYRKFQQSVITVNFPIKRKLVDYGLHELDQLLTKNNENEENSSDQIYDPVFFLPLFEVFLSLNNFNFISLATKKNLLGLLPLGLSFEDLKKIIPKGHKSGDKIEFPRVAPVSSQLLSEFFNVIPNKLHCVHSILANYVIVREIFDFATIPEFMILMCSYELNQEEHRLFLLNTINDGIRDELDFKLLNNTPIIKMLLSCFGTTISSRKIDLLILKIIDNLIVKAKATEFLTDRYGLLLWMYQRLFQMMQKKAN